MYSPPYNPNVIFQECLKFLKEIQTGGTRDFSTRPFQHSGAVSTLYGDTTATFSKVLLSGLQLCFSMMWDFIIYYAEFHHLYV